MEHASAKPGSSQIRSLQRTSRVESADYVYGEVYDLSEAKVIVLRDSAELVKEAKSASVERREAVQKTEAIKAAPADKLVKVADQAKQA